MNSTLNNLPPLLDFLQGLMPPSHIALVGAGNGKTPWAQWINTQAVPAILVEADDQQFATLQRQQAAGSWAQARLLHAVVAAEAGEVAFYTSNLATESGLLPAEDLRQLWPNLHTLQSSQRQATALAQLLALEQAQAQHQWLLLDCLPAASLLKTAASALSQLDVVVARVVLTENKSYQIPGAGLAELTGLLPAFTQLALQPTRHPDIAYALFVRDYRSATVQALKAHAAEGQAKQAAQQAQADLQAQLAKIQTEKAEMLKKQELQAQAQQALQADLIQTAHARDTEAKAKQAAQQAQADLQAQLAKIQTEKAEMLKKQELQAQAQQALQADLIQTAHARDTEAKAKQAAQQAQADLQARLDKPQQKFSSDADIDDFIEDIAPFFLNRSIVYVDVGAYIGEVFTKLLASKKFKIREAHLIEPNPESYQKLQAAAKASKMQSCNTYHIGISNNVGTAKFKAAQSMTKRVRADISSENSSNIFETECRKLDDIAELFTDRRAHLMKLDVEGEELDVLKSAQYLLEEQRIDVLYVEVGFNRSGTQQTYFGNLDALLQKYGYRVFKIYEQKNEWIDDSPLLRRCNVAYMSSGFSSMYSYSKISKMNVL